MRAVVQLVKKAAVSVNGSVISEIGPGLLVLLGIRKNDIPGDARILAEKIAHLRIFPDKSKLMNLSLLDVGGQMLVVSQFTLYGDCRLKNSTKSLCGKQRNSASGWPRGNSRP